ncbi:MAG TPA: hypothetical protein VK447_16015 [Myxococcaceae bacterium]|nr:hypothetical protein [Myxococcaceae bacterium]
MRGKTWSTRALTLFAPILIVVGVLGFVLPPDKSLTSGAPAYNVFHIVFGIVGLACLATRREPVIRGFLVGFGLIDLYQALASFAGLFPKELFRWTVVDDVLHVTVGLALVAFGVWGSAPRTQPATASR